MAASRARSGSLPETYTAECGAYTGEQGRMGPSLQLPAMHELPSLTTQLITPALARAFDIPHERQANAAIGAALQAGRMGQQGLDLLTQYNQGLQFSQQQQQSAGTHMAQQAAQMAQMQGAGGYGGGMMGNDTQNRQGFGQQQYNAFPGAGQDYYNPAYMMGQQMQQNGSGAAPYPLFQQPNMFGFDAREAMAAGYNLGHFQGSLQQQQQHAQQKEQQQRDAQVQQEQHQQQQQQQEAATPAGAAQPPAKRPHPDTQADDGEDTLARALKRPRLVWTPKLHQRFVEAVEQLGLKVAVPKTIMQMMNVEGLTRENVASHLQKFRLQLKRENRLDEEGNLLSPLKGSKLGGSDEDAHGSATSADRDDGAGAKGSTPSSHPVDNTARHHGPRDSLVSAMDPRDEAVVPNLMLLKEGHNLQPARRDV